MEKDRGGGGGEGGSSTTLAPLFLLNPLASTNLVGRREEGEATLMRGSPPRKDGGRTTGEGRERHKAKGKGKEERREGGRGDPCYCGRGNRGRGRGGGEKFKGRGGSQMGMKRRSHFECRLHFTRSP